MDISIISLLKSIRNEYTHPYLRDGDINIIDIVIALVGNTFELCDSNIH